MLLNRIAQFLLRSQRNAIMVVVLLCLMPPMIASLSSIIVGLITLRQGVKEGFVLTLWASMPFAALAYVHDDVIVSLLPFLAFVGVWVMAAVLRVTASWSFLLQVFALVGVAAVLSAHLFVDDVVAFWAQWMQAHIAQMQSMMPEVTMQVNQKAIAHFAMVATGLAVAAFLLSTSMKLLIARWWQGLVFNPGGLQKELHHIKFGPAILLVGIGLLIAVALKNTVAIDAVIPWLACYIGAGLSLMHFAFKRSNFGWGFVVIFYVTAMFLPEVLLVPVVVAVVDTLVNFRGRISQEVEK